MGKERDQSGFKKPCNLIYKPMFTLCQEWEEYKGQLGGNEELSDAQLAARLQVYNHIKLVGGFHLITSHV